MNKIRNYFSTLDITRGLLIAILSSLFIYLEHIEQSNATITTISGILAIYLLLSSNTKTWLFTGFFIGILWFWWVAMSFIHYSMPWAIPFVIFAMGLLYAVLFWVIARISEYTMLKVPIYLPYIIKALGLLLLSYIHPFGFDWFKPELMFVNTYIGVEKWQFAIVLLSITLSLFKKNLLYLAIIVLAIQTKQTEVIYAKDMQGNHIELVATTTNVEDKWNKSKHSSQFKEIFQHIESAIDNNKTIIVLPETIFPIFLNYNLELIYKLKEKSKNISIVVGGLFWNGKTPHNSTYIFTNGLVKVANKVILVPFGESNPLPDFLSDWVNRVFYDGAVDYVADTDVTDYKIDEVTYRNAICFESTSEKLYEKNSKGERPNKMIVLSNNGWFTPSVEPTLQKLLLIYYSKKYGTTIYHAINMSDSYIINSK